MKHSWLFLFLLIGFTQCNNYQYGSYSRRNLTADTVFVHADARCYGQFYAGVNGNVCSMNLYSASLSTDSTGTLHGTGTIVSMSDIIIPLTDTVLPDGVYRVDSLAEPWHILRGQSVDKTLIGARLRLVQDGVTAQTYLFEKGEIECYSTGDSTWMELHLTAGEGQTYHAVFEGTVAYD